MKLSADPISKVAGIIIGAFSVYFGLTEYAKNNEREFRKNVFDRQTQIYENLLSDLGRMKTAIEDSSSAKEFDASFKDFKTLYYGELNLYQDSTIENASDKLFDEIETFRSEYNMRKVVDTGSVKVEIDKIQDDIYKLAKQCNTALKNTYQVNEK